MEKIDELIKAQNKTNELLQQLLNIFIQYDQSYQNEILKDQGRNDIVP